MTADKKAIGMLCISSFFKGEEFMRSAKREGCVVYLVTSKQLEHDPWPRESIDEIFYVRDVDSHKGHWNMQEVADGMAYMMRTRKIDRVVALDDFDVEKAAHLREHFRIPGMGETTCRYFRDKLAMRVRALEGGIPVPAFSALFNDEEINHFLDTVPAPWLVKPRSEASATGIQKAHSKEEAWAAIHGLGDRRHYYLIERFCPGDVFHVDALNMNGKVVFCIVSRYLNTPMEVAHGGGVFRSATVAFGSEDDKALQLMNGEVMKTFGMQFSASHTEFIKSKEAGSYFFLETSSRVGGANLAEMVQYSSGINLWSEWAKIEAAMARGEKYKAPKALKKHAGIIVSLSRFEHPDSSVFNDPEIVWRMQKTHHIGMIVQSDWHEKIMELLNAYVVKILSDFHASAPPPQRPHS